MKKIFLTCLTFGFVLTLTGQEITFFPERNAQWETKAAKEFNLDELALNRAVQFAEENEYSGSRDLRIAILKGFEREPFHEILGPTKKRGGPAGKNPKKG